MIDNTQEIKNTIEYDYSLGEKCYGIKLGWAGKGTPEAPFRRVDILGAITSIKGLAGHNNIHKYEFKWDGGYYYTDNLSRELLPILPKG